MRRMMARVRDRVQGYPAVVWLLGLGSFINVGGLSLLWPVNSIYIHSVLHKPLTVAGLVLMVYSGAGFIGSFLGGWLYDRIGAVPVLVAGLAVSVGSILLPVFSPNWLVYVVVMAVFGTACAMPFPVLNAMAGHAWPEGGRRAFNFIYVANNIGVAAGTAIGGVLAQWSFRAVFIGIAISFTVFLTLVMSVFRARFRVMHEQGRRLQEETAAAEEQAALPSVPWVPILILFSGFVLSWAIYVQWQSTISVYMQAIGYPLTAYSVLWTVNGLLIFVLQPLMAVIVRRVPTLSIHMMVGLVLYAAAYAMLVGSHSYAVFVAAMVVMTVGELFVWPSVPAAVAQLSPVHRLGMLQGLVGSAATLGRMIGPVIGGYLYDRISMAHLLGFLVFSTAIPFVCYLVFDRLFRRSPSAPGQQVSL